MKKSLVSLCTDWNACLSTYRTKLVCKLEARAKQRELFIESDTQPFLRDIQIRLGIIDLEGESTLVEMLQRLLQKRSAGKRGLEPEVDVGVDVFAVAETAAFSYKKFLRQKSTLKSIRDACWESGSATKVEWHGPGGKKDELDKWESETRAWLFGREESGAARVEVKAGDLHLVRCPAEKETPETRTALCQFFDVPLDTPGVDDTSSCVRLTSLWEGMVYATPSNLPPNGTSNGIVASIIYAKQALLTPTASVSLCPHAHLPTVTRVWILFCYRE